MTNPPHLNKFPKLHAYIAQQGFCSRRKAEELIREGKVTVNGKPAHVGQRVNPASDQVSIAGKTLATRPAEAVGYLLYKPVGVVSTTSDELGRRNVVQELQKHLREQKLPRLYPVGRLDKDSEGLILLTNDGQFAQKLTHPSFETDKTYRVTVAGRPSVLAIAHLERGVRLKEGYTAPAKVVPLQLNDDASTLDITIHEGMHQQVRRMCERVGYPVLRLIRTHLGPFSLDQLEGKTWKRIDLDNFTQNA